MKTGINKSILVLVMLAASVSMARAAGPCDLMNRVPCPTKKTTPPVMPPSPRPIPTLSVPSILKPILSWPPAIWPGTRH